MNETPASPSQYPNPQPTQKPLKLYNALATFRLVIGVLINLFPIYTLFSARAINNDSYGCNLSFQMSMIFFIFIIVPLGLMIALITAIWRHHLRKKFNIPKETTLPNNSTTGLVLCCFSWVMFFLCGWIENAFVCHYK